MIARFGDLNLFERHEALTEVQRALVLINGKASRAVTEFSPQRNALAKAQARCLRSVTRAGIPRYVFDTNWDSTSLSCKTKGGKVGGYTPQVLP